jgi:hypothetical protein
MRIVIHNPEHICRGVVKMTVDGNLIEGSLIPPDLEEGEHHIEVWIGKNHE